MTSLRKAISLAATTAACLLTLSCSAFAGSYVVSACSPSSTPGLWVQTNGAPAGFATGNLCGGPAVGPVDGGNTGSLYAEDILGSAALIPDGARAGWTFNAPPGTTITAISYYRRLAAYKSNNGVAGLYQANGAALEECFIQLPLGSSIFCTLPNNQAPVTFSGLSTSSLFFGIACRIVDGASACITGGTIHHTQAQMYSARVTLAESSAPSLSNVGGALWSGGLVSGVVPVSFSASDATGIKEQLVRSDAGQTLISSPQACDFTLAQPCPQQPTGVLNVDTTRVPDGPRTFSVVVVDAAGNSQIATSPTVIVDNQGPPPPPGFTATAKTDGSNTIALAWRNPPNAPAAVTGAMVQLCETSCPAAQRIGASGAAQITAPGPGLYSVRLWLLDTAGRGGAHNAALASVRVPASTSGRSTTSTRTKISAVLKGSRLRVSGSINRTGRVRVSWRSKVGRRTVGAGSRVVTIRKHKIALNFTLSARARRGTTRIAIRSGSRIVGHALARRS